MELLEPVLVHRHHHVGARLVHGQRLGHHERRGSEHHVAGNHGHIRVARSLQRRVQTRQRPAHVERVAHQLDAILRELSVQEVQALRLVRGDHEVVGNRAQTLHQPADQRAARERHGRLALPHAPALAARLDDHGHARPHETLLHEVGESSNVVERERRHVVQLGGMARLLDVGDDGHRVRRRQLVRYVGVVGMLRLEMVS